MVVAKAVQPGLTELGFLRPFSERERNSLATPINLWVFAHLGQSGRSVGNVLSGVGLFDDLLARRAIQFHEMGIT